MDTLATLPVNTAVATDVFMMKFAVLMVIVQLSVKQYRAVAQTDLFGSEGPAKPWPLINLAICGLVVYNYTFLILEANIGHTPTGALPVIGNFPLVDYVVSTGAAAGGATGIVDIIKAVTKVKKKAKAATI